MTADTAPFASLDPSRAAVLLIDLQNDFLHPNGAYARGGVTNADVAAVTGRLIPVVAHARALGLLIVATSFTLPPGRGGEPLISPHLAELRPFLRRGDFEPGAWGHRTVDELQPIDTVVEKVAYSAFHQSRLDHVLHRSGITQLVVGGIVTNGGVASTVRDAHVRDYDVTVLRDGCAAFDRGLHDATIRSLQGGVARSATCAEFEQHQPSK